MPKFGKQSYEKLLTCDSRIQLVMTELIKHVDFVILEGHRTKEKQNEYFRTGKSKLKWPDGKHCSTPSKAIDIAPYFPTVPHVRWNGKFLRSFDYLAGWVMGISVKNGIVLRWGGDWDRDLDLADQTFNDLPHFELID